MQLVSRLWAIVTTVLRIGSLSPVPDDSIGSLSVQIPFRVEPSTSSTLNSPKDGASIAEDAAGPIFIPPGTNTGFTCDYSAMKGWETCTTERDRQCWLRRRIDGKRFDVFTNYEEEMPVGIDRFYQLDLADGWWAADGINFTDAKLYNDIYPGPWIEACWGDRVHVNVTNSLRHNGTSVHWHGIRQLNTTHMDGVNGVTQCPIARGDHFVYSWTARQYGSAWYHSHYSVQYADGAAGPLTLHGPTSANYDEAVNPPLLVTDWGHSSAFVANAPGLLDQKDILLNGRGNVTRYNNTRQPDAGITIDPLYNITFDRYQPGKPVKKYLLRIINTSFDTTFVVSIDNHLMQIVTTDFVPISPYTNTSVLVGIGQRYNVIVEANPIVNEDTGPLDLNGNYWIRTEVANCFQMKGGDRFYEQSGIVRYDASSKADPTTSKWKKVALECSDETYEDLHPILQWDVMSPVNGAGFGEQFEAKFLPQRPPDSYPLAKFALDLTSSDFTPLRVDYLNPPFLHLDNQGDWNKAWRIVPENWGANDWVYIVIQSSNPHPMHLHGHDFAILEQAYNKTFNSTTMNLKLLNPPRRDVVLLPTRGYVVIAFKADNPGPWLVHCHIAEHISWGLGMTILERQDSARGLWPGNDPASLEAKRVCANWDKWYNNHTNWADNPDCQEADKTLCFQDDSGV